MVKNTIVRQLISAKHLGITLELYNMATLVSTGDVGHVLAVSTLKIAGTENAQMRGDKMFCVLTGLRMVIFYQTLFQ